jgi:hypothetical protein
MHKVRLSKLSLVREAGIGFIPGLRSDFVTQLGDSFLGR